MLQNDVISDGSATFIVRNKVNQISEINSSLSNLSSGLNSVNSTLSTINDYVVESYHSGTSWWEVYKSGKIRQGGVNMNTQGDVWYTITLLKPMATTDYFIYDGILTTQSSNAAASTPTFRAKTRTNFIAGFKGANYAWGYHWVVEGY